MGNKTVVYEKKLQNNLNECYKHFERMQCAFDALSSVYPFPLDYNSYQNILLSSHYVAYTDQIVYRFTKLQDTMGGRLFKSFLLYQGENTDKPFLDILNRLEAMNVLIVDNWFELRDLRNEITHEYDDNKESIIAVLNMINLQKKYCKEILDKIKSSI